MITHRRRALLLGISTVILSLASTGWAYWNATGSAAGSATTGTLNPPTNTVVPATSTGTVHISWTAPVNAPAGTGYYVTRVRESNGATAAACGTSPSAPTATTTCDDLSVPDATYHYLITAMYRSWTAIGAASGSVTVQHPTQLAFTTQPSTTTAGATVSPAVTVTVEDASGAAVPIAGTQVTVAIGANPASGTLSGTTAASTNAAGVASFTTLSIDKAASGYTLTAAGTGLAGATSQTFTVTPAATTTLAITTGPVSGPASAGAALGPITVQVRDAFGNATTAPAGGTVVNLSSSSTGATFAATPGGSAVTSVTIAAGASSAAFYYGDTKAGTPTITTTSTGLTAAPQTETITAASASRLVFTTTAVSGKASGSASLGPITVQLRDAFGNVAVAPAGGTVVSLASNSAGVTVFATTAGNTTTTSTVTIAAGTSSVSFYYGDTKVGGPTITASSTGLTPATQTEAITAADPKKLCIAQFTDLTCSPTVAPKKGSASTYYVVLRDQWDNLTTTTTAITVTLSSSGGSVNPTSLPIAAGQSNGSFTFNAPNGNGATGTITASSSGLSTATTNYTTTN